MAINYKSMFDNIAQRSRPNIEMTPPTNPTPNVNPGFVQQPTPTTTAATTRTTTGAKITPPNITQATQTGKVMNPAETADYRDLLNQQLMTESSKANAAKYISAAMQSSGVAQTGLAQSILSGIEMGYSGMAAQNVAQYNLQQQQLAFEQQQSAGAVSAQEQQAVAETAFTFLQNAQSRDDLKTYYDEYYNDLTPEQQRAFDLLYKERSNELQFTGAPTQEEINAARTAFPDTTAAYTSTDNVLSFANQQMDRLYTVGETQSETYGQAQLLASLVQQSSTWGNTRNGTVYYVKTPNGNKAYGFYGGRWYVIPEYVEGNATRVFDLT